MTFEEAKKILESEGFEPKRILGVLVEDVKAASWEKIEVDEAMKVVAENGYFPFMEKSKYEERKARLQKEYKENTKAPGPGEKQSKEGNPALKEALNESASQFNDALLDEQAKKIEELTMENERLKDQVTVLDACKENNEKYNLKQIKRLGKEIARLNKIIHKKNLKIEELGKESSRHLEGKMKMFGENFDFEQELKDKNAVLADVAEKLRLSKIREKNLTEVCQKYIKANEELKEKLANKVVDKIDAQALKSAESALAWKEKVIAEKDMALSYYEKKIAEKDEVIADLGKELKAKHKKYVWYKGAYDAAQQILNTIADYAAKHPDKKISDPMVGKNHPTIDNPEEIEIEKDVKLVRKAMKEGHTVTINYRD